MITSTSKSNTRAVRSLRIRRVREVFALSLLLGSIVLPGMVKGQTDFSDNFNSYNNPGDDQANGWGHLDLGTAGAQVYTYTFPTNSNDTFPGTGKGFRTYGGPGACVNIINVGGVYRSEQYTECFVAADVINFEKYTLGSAAGMSARFKQIPGSAVNIQGYLGLISLGTPLQRLELMANIAFFQEITSTIVDGFRGGLNVTAQFPPSRRLRMVLSGITNSFQYAVYDAFDLLEPLAKINWQDTTAHESDRTVGENILGGLNLSADEVCDFTWDNFRETGTRTTPIGFPGTPQVLGLIPPAQALFYTISNNPIHFTATALNTNQIDTNTLQMFLIANNVTNEVTSQLTFAPQGTASAKTNYLVTYTGSLASNTVYHGKIIVKDPTGRGTTNNWYFDTFGYFVPGPANTTGFLLVEAEDYNYDGGSFQPNPPVSGTDDTTTSDYPIFDATTLSRPPPSENLGPQVNGNGIGYFDLQGIEDVDYHDNTYQKIDPLQRNQYRSLDRVGTVQGTKNGGADTPRAYRANLANNSAGLSYVPDYIVASMDPGDWMNYTRNFPTNNYNVYLRASSQAAQTVRLDEVTSDRTTSNQTTVLRGQFLVPNTASITRFRYVPLTDGAGNLQTIHLEDVKTLRLTAYEAFKEGVLDSGDLQLNWILFVPTTAPASSGPWVGYAYPSANSEKFSPDGAGTLVSLPDRQSPNAHPFGPTAAYGPNAPATFMILDRGTPVATNTIQLKFDSSLVSPVITGSTPEGSGATVTYRPPFLLPNTVHSINLVFGNGATTQTNQWTFTVDPFLPLLSTSDAVGGSADTVFSLKLNKSPNTSDPSSCAVNGPWENNLARAEVQLAGRCLNSDNANQPYPNEAANQPDGVTGLYTETNAVNWVDGCGTTLPFFTGARIFPGLEFWDCSQGFPQHFAESATVKLQLSPGVYRMGVTSDDGFKVTAGGPYGTNVWLGCNDVSIPNTRGDGQFEFAVQTSGVYMFRLVMEQGGGNADCEWYWISRYDGARRLVSVLSIPAGTCPIGAGGDPGFTVQIAKARNDAPDTPDFDDTPDRAEKHLAGQLIDANTGQPYVNEAAGTNNGFYNVSLININQSGCCAGFFGADSYFPGIGPTDPGWNGGDPNHISMAATAYLELTAGSHVLGVRSDDGFRLTTGSALPATNLIVGAFDGARASSPTEFEFIAPVSGLYPFRLLYYEGTGGADVEFYSIDPATGLPTLINDPGNPNAIKAYRNIGVRILNPRRSGSNFSFDFATCPGKTYTPQYKNALTDATWTDLPSINGDGTVKTATDNTGSPAKRLYRVKMN